MGAVKSQKNYSLALRILKAVHKRLDAYLVIIGGPVNTREGRSCWESVVDEINRLELRHRVAMPGFIPDAMRCLPTFDVMLNTSHYEGLSIATLEALTGGKSVVASQVGGQGEIASDGLILVSEHATDDVWVDALEKGLQM